jgi:hypothetical protein
MSSRCQHRIQYACEHIQQRDRKDHHEEEAQPTGLQLEVDEPGDGGMSLSSPELMGSKAMM